MQTQEANQTTGQRPPARKCGTKGCGGMVEPYLRPGFAGQPAKWLWSAKCAQCTEAEARKYNQPTPDPAASLAHWAGLPAASQGWSLDAAKCKARQAKQEAEDLSRWLDAFGKVASWEGLGRWLVLYGPPGLGKTTLGYALLNRHIRRSRSRAFFLSCLDLAPALGGESGEVMLQRAKEAGLLLLDGLGTVKATQRVWGALVAIVDARRREKRPTVLTLDFVPAELPKRLRDKNKALTLRITEHSELVSFAGRPFPELGGA